MVWCYEGSHKKTSMEQRSALITIASRSGGRFRCFKKAKQFYQWSLKQNNPFILCTDWREAKPCVQAMTHQGQHVRALFTIVVCASDKQQTKAQSWLSKLTEWRDVVHVVVDFSSIERMVPGLLPLALQALDNSADTQRCQDGGVQAQELQATPNSALIQPTVACGKALPQQIKLAEATHMKNAQAPVAIQESQDAKHTCHVFQQTHFGQYEVLASQPPSANVMWLWQSAPPTHMAPVWMIDNCPVKTEEVLLAARPDTYED